MLLCLLGMVKENDKRNWPLLGVFSDVLGVSAWLSLLQQNAVRGWLPSADLVSYLQLDRPHAPLLWRTLLRPAKELGSEEVRQLQSL